MKIEFSNKDKQLKALLLATNDKDYSCCLLSVAKKALYFSNEKFVIKINLNITDIQEDEEEVLFSIDKLCLVHLMDYSTIVNINSKNKYFTDTNISGTFNKNESFLYSYSSYLQVFEDVDSYQDYFEIKTVEDLNKLRVASYFTYNKDKNPQSWFIFLENNIVFSSSLYRIYTNKFEGIENKKISILQDLLDIINFYPLPIRIKKLNKSIAILDSDVQIVCSNIEKVESIPIFDSKFTEVKNELLNNGHKIQCNCEELLNKLEYMKWYAKDFTNFRTRLLLSKNSLSFTIKENESKLEILNDNDNDLEFYFNLDSLLSALKGRYSKDEKIILYFSSDINLFCVQLGQDEFFYTSKIVNQ
jgi:hypothetical protein